MKRTTHAAEPEFSRPMAVDKIPSAGLTLKLEPNEAQRAALTKRFALLDLSRLEAEISVRPAETIDGIAVTGTLTADAVQQCGVTLEPLPVHIEAPIDAIFIEPPSEGDDGSGDSGGLDLSHEEADIELIDNGYIDLGELLAQNLGISLDPYPRKEGLPPVTTEFGEPPESTNPFVKLAEWQKKPKDNG